MNIDPKLYKNNLPVEPEDNHEVQVLSEYLRGESKVIGLFGDYGSGKSSIIKKVEEENKHIDFHILSVPNFMDTNTTPKNMDESVIKQEVRKSITMQLISLFDSNDEIKAIKKKLLIHTFEMPSYWDILVVTVLVSLFLIQVTFDFSLDNIYANMSKYIWITIFILFMLILVVRIFCAIKKMIIKIKNAKLTDFKFSQISLKQDGPNTFIDYDLETIVALIEASRNSKPKDWWKFWEKPKNKEVVIVIEDVDRYDSVAVFQELMHIVNACKKVKFIIPMKHGILNSISEEAKYFDAQCFVLPVNDKMNLYEYIEKTLSENSDFNVNAEVLRQTSPYIDDFRVFNAVYNKYLSLIENYTKIDDEPSIDERSNIYAISVLQTLMPEEVKNVGATNTKFSMFCDSIFDKKEIVKYLTKGYKKIIDVTKKSQKLEGDADLVEKEIKNINEENLKNTIKFLNYDLYFKMKANNMYMEQEIKGDDWSYPIHTIYSRIEEGEIFTLDELEQIISIISDQDESFGEFKDYIHELQQENKLLEFNEKSKEFREKDECDKLNEQKKEKIKKLNSSELIIEFGLSKYLDDKLQSIFKNVYEATDDKATSDKATDDKVMKYKDLIINLIMTGYFTEKYKNYISKLSNDISTVKLREFKYDISGTLESYIFINDDDDFPCEVNQNFIDSFSIYEFSKAKFVKKSIIKFLINNVNESKNKEKFKKICNQLVEYVEDYNTFNFKNTLKLRGSKKEEVILLLEYLLENEENEDKSFALEVQSNFIELFYFCNSNVSISFLTNLVKNICTENDSIKMISNMKNPDIIWRYIDYNLDEFNFDTLIQLMDFFEKKVLKSMGIKNIFSNIENIGSKLSYLSNTQYNIYINMLVEKQLFEYNNKNIEYIFEDDLLISIAMNNYAEEFINCILESEISQVDKKVKKLANFKEIDDYKLQNLKKVNDEVAKRLIEENLYALNEENLKYFIDSKNYKEILEKFDLKNYNSILSRDIAGDILNYLDKSESEDYIIDKFINGLDYKYDVGNIENKELLATLIERDKVRYSIENSEYIKEYVPDKSLNLIQNTINSTVNFNNSFKNFAQIEDSSFNNINYKLDLDPKVENQLVNHIPIEDV